MSKSSKYKPRKRGDIYRPRTEVMVEIDGEPVKVKLNGKTFVRKFFKQQKGRFKQKH